jgi:putative nucleotidyltransferase with HDIG domain
MTFALFARPKKTTDTPPPRTPPGGDVFAKLSRLERLPHLSDTTVRAMALASDPDATLADMAALIRRDGVLAAAILKVANSVVYRGGTDVTDVQQAVMRIGLRGCANILAAAGVKTMYATLTPAAKVACENVLRHSLFVGGLATAVARALRLTLGGDEYSAGLLHDIGRVVMCVHAPDLYAGVWGGGSDAGPHVRAAETAAFGTDHCAVGLLFAVKNNLPARIGKAVQHHHNPEAADGDGRPLTAVVSLADSIANHLHEHRNLDAFSVDTDPAFEMLRRLVVSERAVAFPDQLKGLVVKCVRETRTVLKSLGNDG